MDFKELYKEWLDKNGGLSSSIQKCYSDLSTGKKEGSIITEKVSSPFLKRGSLFVFDYVDPEMIKRVTTGDVPYFDGHPFILALEHDKEFQYGLDLNVLPINARVLLFTMIFKAFNQEIQYNLGLKYERWHEFKRIDSKNVSNLVKMKSDIAINKYSVDLMQHVKAVKWETVIPASTLYMQHNIIFNKKKNLNLQTLWKLIF